MNAPIQYSTRISGQGAGGREILIAGLGSVGRRHLANLRALGQSRLRLYRTGHSTLPDIDTDLTGVPVDYDLAAALAHRPLAVIVSNPHALHLPVALEAACAGSHLLIEKPLSHHLDGISELEDVVRARSLTALVGYQFRFNPGLQQIKAWIDHGEIGSIRSAQVHWGEYLPQMHPWEDYRSSHVARPELGGGVVLTLSHPLDYLRWMLGEVDEVSAIEARDDSLGIKVETCVDIDLRFVSGASGHVHVNFLQQPPEHRLLIIGTKGTITWSQDDHAARKYCVQTKRWETVWPPDGFERNSMFLAEMRHFLACVNGVEQPLCTLRDGREVVRIAMAAKRVIGAAEVSSQEACAMSSRFSGQTT